MHAKAVLDSDRRAIVKLIAAEPKVLTEEQKKLRVTICGDLSDSMESDSDLMDLVIIDDETWSDRPTEKGPNEQVENQNHAHCLFFLEGNCPQRVCTGRDDHRVRIRCAGAVGETLVAQVRPDIVDRWRLHHDNAPAPLVRVFLAKKKVATLP
ncbi:hypothetical protein J437_LFUL006870 [Ladona fulva]|uniref:Uncharacterized protein n=1 Tax=Ladona fulva TaxID=123851 RepID=A0A8K0KG50_LADFU|nr:hypothetical protein J437_LFUL006870 [Ladona fulva]